MSVPICIPKRKNHVSIRNSIRGNRIDNSCSSCESHPLDEESDDDSLFDDSFENSSIISSNSSIVNSPVAISLKSMSSPKISALHVERTNLSFKREKNDLIKRVTTKSNLSKFWTHNVMEFTEFKLLKRENDPKIIDDSLPPIELQTFKFENSFKYVDSLPKSSNFKNRDERINSKFLKLYSIDYSARVQNLIPDSNREPIPPHQAKFHQAHNLYKLSNDSKDKLWKSIILQPRTDSQPKPYIDHSNYVFVGGEPTSNSITMKNGNILPWSSDKPSLKPTGVLIGKKVINSPNPSSGVTSCQYTIKGWCNLRWLSNV